MLRRIMGLILIISVLMPVILGVAGFFVVRQIVTDIDNATRGPLGQIETRLNDVKTTLNNASQAFQGLSSAIASITSALSGVVNTINVLATSIGPIDVPDFSVRIPVIDRRVAIPVPDIPAFSVPGLAQLKSLLSNFFGIFGNVTSVLQRISAIQALPEQLNGIVAEVSLLLDNMREIGGRWLDVLSLIAVVLLFWVSATYVALVYRWISGGWQMLQGKPLT